MSLTRFAGISGLLMMLSGCELVSIHPLFTEKDVVFEPALVAAWLHEDGSELVFRQEGTSGYKLAYKENKDKSAEQFEARLVRLESHLFLDVWPEVSTLQIPGHYFAKVRLRDNYLELSFMDTDWLRDMIRASAPVAHEVTRRGSEPGQMILTASTKDLQSFVLRLAAEPKAFGEPGLFKRREGGA